MVIPTPTCAGYTGEVLKVKVLTVEGVANHDSPESCVGVGDEAGEALTGGDVGPVLSRESNESLLGADLLGGRGRPHRGARDRECLSDPARSQTRGMRPHTSCGTREIRRLAWTRDGAQVGIGNPKGARR